MRLVVQAGPLAGKSFELTRENITIGRSAVNQIVLSDSAISRAHCEIRLESGRYVIEDRNSVNGTMVNDQKITGLHVLQPGDLVRVGNTVLVVEESVARGMPAGTGPVTAPGRAYVEPASRSGRTTLVRWTLLGIAALALLAVAGAVLLSTSSPQQLALVPSPTVAPISTATSSPLPSPTLVPVTPSPAAPTATAPASPDAATATRFANPLWTATPIRTPSPTALPPKLYPMPVPTVLLPTPQAIYKTNAPIPFSWIAPGVLRPTEIYRVQVSLDPNLTQIACEIKTRETYVTIPGEGAACTDFWQFGQHYYWRVQVVLRDAPLGEISSVPVGLVHEFTWSP